MVVVLSFVGPCGCLPRDCFRVLHFFFFCTSVVSYKAFGLSFSFLFLISPSFDASGRLYFLIVVFPGRLQFLLLFIKLLFAWWVLSGTMITSLGRAGCVAFLCFVPFMTTFYIFYTFWDPQKVHVSKHHENIPI